MAEKLRNKMNLHIDFVSLVLRVGQRIDQQIVKASDETHPNSLLPLRQATDSDLISLPEKRIEEILKDNIMAYAEFYEEKIGLPNKDKGLFQRIFPQLNWQNITTFLKQEYIKKKGFVKRNGIGVSLGLFIGIACEITTYTSLTMLGLTALLPTAMAIPYGTIISAPALIYQNIRMRLILRETLGSVEAVKAYKYQLKDFYKELNMKPRDFLFPLENLRPSADNNVHALILRREGFWVNLASLIGLHFRTLNIRSLKLFLTTHNIEDPRVKLILENKAISTPVKVGIISDLLLSSPDEEVANAFKVKFHAQIVELKRFPYWRDLEKWVERLMIAKSFGEVKFLLSDIPEGVSSMHVIELFENIILPHYSVHFPISYGQFRSLKEDIASIKAGIYQQPYGEWNAQNFTLFVEKIGKTLKEPMRECQEPERSALRYILNTGGL